MKLLDFERTIGVIVCLVFAALVTGPFAQAQETIDDGVMLGRVYKVDKERYLELLHEAEKEGAEGAVERFREFDPDEYLDRLGEVMIRASHVPTNRDFLSESSSESGDFLIGRTPFGAFRFEVTHEEQRYPVEQTLDLNVELRYVAELCFVVDEDEERAWLISQTAARSPETPLFVPDGCRSAIGECLAMLTGISDELPEGILLLLAGGGAATTSLGIISTEQLEASPVVRPPEP